MLAESAYISSLNFQPVRMAAESSRAWADQPSIGLLLAPLSLSFPLPARRVFRWLWLVVGAGLL